MFWWSWFGCWLVGLEGWCCVIWDWYWLRCVWGCCLSWFIVVYCWVVRLLVCIECCKFWGCFGWVEFYCLFYWVFLGYCVLGLGLVVFKCVFCWGCVRGFVSWCRVCVEDLDWRWLGMFSFIVLLCLLLVVLWLLVDMGRCCVGCLCCDWSVVFDLLCWWRRCWDVLDVVWCSCFCCWRCGSVVSMYFWESCWGLIVIGLVCRCFGCFVVYCRCGMGSCLLL